MTNAERELVIAEALTWEGTPYHSNAAVKGSGADCALLPLAVYRKALGRLPSLTLPDYKEQWHLHRGEELYLDYVRALGAVEVETPAPGDFVLFKQGRLYSHGAIVLAWPNVIHAAVISGVVKADAEAIRKLARAPRFYFTL